MDINNAETLIEAGRKVRSLELAGKVHELEGFYPFMVKPNGNVKLMEAFRRNPSEVRGLIRVDDAKSFAAYVNRFKDEGTMVFADLAGQRYEAVLDYSIPAGLVLEENPATPRWGNHRVVLACTPTPEWQAWASISGKPQEQREFALFIERNQINIYDPPPATMLQIARALEAKKDVAFRSSVRLDNGETQFRYEETIDAKAGSTAQGDLKIPTEFKLGIEVFRGQVKANGEPDWRPVSAYLRYNITGSKLMMWFELVRPQDVLRKAFEDLTVQLTSELDGVPMIFGAAPALTAPQPDGDESPLPQAVAQNYGRR